MVPLISGPGTSSRRISLNKCEVACKSGNREYSIREKGDRMMKKSKKSILCFSVAILSMLILAALCGLPAAAQQTPQVLSNAVANAPIQFDVSRPLAQLLREAPAQLQGDRVTHAPMQPKLQQLKGAQLSQGGVAASALQPLIAPLSAISATIGLSFEGVSVFDCRSVVGFRVAPPDTNAAVGDTQVV